MFFVEAIRMFVPNGTKAGDVKALMGRGVSVIS